MTKRKDGSQARINLLMIYGELSHTREKLKKQQHNRK